ncbi:hypothetical protein [Gloeobacter kilaueensis]|uniref:WYL domain-containing protein n=1 Tax=Gloeobacter kilaueensis (strain ATCC BAA-2537 / CCAP 1431/1 / ULC 316 / JS1) TaxID=1183438 RepID=U5QHP9_GLOK1|nr:hypothetical protein [Gloeobacter kilaueensis]AGY58446.1 hypothetical protein GKIL_2200 [Gloeobacter kilaueensis JS1]
MADTYEIIANAIRNKQQIIATYDGHERELCPHSLGTKNGTLQCLFYQFGGYSSKGKIEPGSSNNWRCLSLSKLSNVKTRDGNWYTAYNHSRPNSCIDNVEIEVTS